jgi:hypothetical protein
LARFVARVRRTHVKDVFDEVPCHRRRRRGGFMVVVLISAGFFFNHSNREVAGSKCIGDELSPNLLSCCFIERVYTI